MPVLALWFGGALWLSGCSRAPVREDTPSVVHPPAQSSSTASAPLVASGVDVENERTSGDPPARAQREAESPPVSSGELPKIALPKSTPELLPQLLVCDRKGFGRLVNEGFEYTALEGLRQLALIALANTHNAIRLMGDSALIVTREHVYRYYHGQTQAVAFARIPLLGPLQLWTDEQDIDSFWVRYLRDPDLHHFTLREADASVTMSETRALPSFDGRLFALARSGAPLYSAGNELILAEQPRARRISVESFAEKVVALLPSERLDRVWLLGDPVARLVELSRGRPLRAQLELGGTPLSFDAAKVLAVVTVGTGLKPDYQLEVYDADRQLAKFPLPPLEAGSLGSAAPREEDNRSVCLIPGRPWVLVGGRQLLQLFDYQTAKLVFQRLGE